MPICYVCEKEVVQPSGYSSSDILFIGDEPHDKKCVRPFSDDASRTVLRSELVLLGVDMVSLRFTNLWYHMPPTKRNENFDGCFEASSKACLEEAKGKKAILLVGKTVVPYFTGYKVSEVNGLQVQSNMLSAPIIYACVNPSTVTHERGVVGEIRFALTNFVNHLREEGVI